MKETNRTSLDVIEHDGWVTFTDLSEPLLEWLSLSLEQNLTSECMWSFLFREKPTPCELITPIVWSPPRNLLVCFEGMLSCGRACVFAALYGRLFHSYRGHYDKVDSLFVWAEDPTVWGQHILAICKAQSDGQALWTIISSEWGMP